MKFGCNYLINRGWQIRRMKPSTSGAAQRFPLIRRSDFYLYSSATLECLSNRKQLICIYILIKRQRQRMKEKHLHTASGRHQSDANRHETEWNNEFIWIAWSYLPKYLTEYGKIHQQGLKIQTNSTNFRWKWYFYRISLVTCYIYSVNEKVLVKLDICFFVIRN